MRKAADVVGCEPLLLCNLVHFNTRKKLLRFLVCGKFVLCNAQYGSRDVSVSSRSYGKCIPDIVVCAMSTDRPTSRARIFGPQEQPARFDHDGELL